MPIASFIFVLLAAPWPTADDSTSLAQRVAPPSGYVRVAAAPESFVTWLRALPIKSGRPDVLLFDGRRKSDQGAHALVLDMDVGQRDLQQCADAVMRLRAEYLWASSQADRICFRFTSGDSAWWSRWSKGERPRVNGSKVRWTTTASSDASYRGFRRYLTSVFIYAGSYSLERELQIVSDPALIEAGDVFVEGGFPGHAVIVIDVVQNSAGARMFLLAQSFMPAQQIHILRNPSSQTPWYPARSSGKLLTPEWRFEMTDLRRFAHAGCPKPR